MPYYIRIVGMPLNQPCEFAGTFVSTFDAEADEGRGRLVCSETLLRAKPFASVSEAMAFYKTSPACHPFRRTDGKPNRPLTAYTVEIVRA